MIYCKAAFLSQLQYWVGLCFAPSLSTAFRTWFFKFLSSKFSRSSSHLACNRLSNTYKRVIATTLNPIIEYGGSSFCRRRKSSEAHHFSSYKSAPNYLYHRNFNSSSSFITTHYTANNWYRFISHI